MPPHITASVPTVIMAPNHAGFQPNDTAAAAVIYIILALTVIALNIGKLPAVLSSIVSEAFTGSAALGGGVGSAP